MDTTPLSCESVRISQSRVPRTHFLFSGPQTLPLSLQGPRCSVGPLCIAGYEALCTKVPPSDPHVGRCLGGPVAAALRNSPPPASFLARLVSRPLTAPQWPEGCSCRIAGPLRQTGLSGHLHDPLTQHPWYLALGKLTGCLALHSQDDSGKFHSQSTKEET